MAEGRCSNDDADEHEGSSKWGDQWRDQWEVSPLLAESCIVDSHAVISYGMLWLNPAAVLLGNPGLERIGRASLWPRVVDASRARSVLSQTL